MNHKSLFGTAKADIVGISRSSDGVVDYENITYAIPRLPDIIPLSSPDKNGFYSYLKVPPSYFNPVVTHSEVVGVHSGFSYSPPF